MRTPIALLKCVGIAFVKIAGNVVGFGLVGDLLVEFIPELAADIWNSWCENSNEQELAEELEAVAQLSDQDCRELAKQIAQEIAPDLQSDVRDAIATYLAQVPSSVQNSLRRPNDPTGITIANDLIPRKPEDLAKFLPTSMPRFCAGGHPPGIDLQLEELLGVGGFGEVWKARNPHLPGSPFVCLKLCLDEAAARSLRNEVDLLGRVRDQGKHPGIVQLRNTYLIRGT